MSRQSVPRTWAVTTLGEIGDLYCGQSPPSAAVNQRGDGTPYISGPEQWDGHRVHASKWTTEPKRVVPDGTVFITVKGAGVGTVFPGLPGAIGRDIYAFHPDSSLVLRFIERAIRYSIDDMKRHAVGDIPGLSKKHIIDHAIGLPPFGEQERIVSVVDSLLTRLDDAVAGLERVQRNLKRYRASVLKTAVEGRLVPTEAELARTEGRDYEPASVLLDRILAERRRRWQEVGGRGKYVEPAAPDASKLRELPEGWCWATCDQLGDVSGGLTMNSRRDALPVRLPYLRVANVYADELRLHDVKNIGVNEAEIARALLVPGDLLVVEGNGSVDQIGRVAVWDGSIPRCLHQNHLIKVRFQPITLGRWSLTWLLSPSGRRVVEQVASSTSGLHTLSISKVAALPLPLCPLAEQPRIVDEVDRLLSVSQTTAAEVVATSRRCASLRQSTLKWAFEGRLADQDPADEPASILIEHIRAERDVTKTGRKNGGSGRSARRTA